MRHVSAILLMPGDEIVEPAVFAGIIKLTVVVDKDVQLRYDNNNRETVPQDVEFLVKEH